MKALAARVLLIVSFAIAWAAPENACATLFVGSSEAGTISSYTNSGAPINPSLITGAAGFIRDIASAGGKLYVLTITSTGASEVSVYTTRGEMIAPSLITAPRAEAIAVSGHSIFLGTDENHGTVRVYSTSGNLVNAALITGLQPSFEAPTFGDMAISGHNLFVASWGSDNGLTYQSRVGEYTLSGAPVDADLITFRQGIATALAVSDSNIYVRNSVSAEELGLDTIAQYSISGQLINPKFITGVTDPSAIALSDENIFIGNGAVGSGTVSVYTLGGDQIQPQLANNLGLPSLAVSGTEAGVPELFSTFWLALPMLGMFAAGKFARP